MVKGARLVVALAALPLLLLFAGGGGAAQVDFPGAPQSQHFPEFGRCPVAPANRYLRSRVGCLTVKRADFDGDGKPDLVLLYERLDARGRMRNADLKVMRASGGTLLKGLGKPDLNPAVLRIRNLNAPAGVELIVHEQHVTTEEIAGIYTFDAPSLSRAGSFTYDGEDAGYRFGFTCHRPGSIVQHEWDQRIPFKGVWDRTDVTFKWEGAHLIPGATAKVKAKPSPSQVGVHC